MITSTKNIDLLQEKIINQFLLKNNFFENFKEYEGIVKEIDFNTEPTKQINGVDFEILQGNNIINIDSKTQTKNYINKPTSTFCLELSFINKLGYEEDGWFIKNNLTDYYILGWIDDSVTIMKNNNLFIPNPNDIHKIRLMIISKYKIIEKLKELNIYNQIPIAKKYLIENNVSHLYFDYIKQIFYTKLELKKLKEQGIYPKYVTFCYTNNNPYIPEKPINLVLSIDFYKTICDGYYLYTNGICTQILN